MKKKTIKTKKKMIHIKKSIKIRKKNAHPRYFFALDGLSISEMKTSISYLMHLRRDVSLKL
jgi:hypothetical protein